ncbi:hypothetical protein [Paenibacillus luteus]|uniref:hypothetical protein n=1 Tax=Paenibacillus luteus TaxID=2545753 RepID=UPI0011435449|nr:hypothetical protein [Paenibacillus luteus]
MKIEMGIKDLSHAEGVLEFLNAIHGNNTYEIRVLPEGKSVASTTSILRYQGYFYAYQNKKKELLCEESAENFDKVVIEDYLRESLHGAVCFTVNSPNYEIMDSCTVSNSHIRNGGKINSQFVDIDAPKEYRLDAKLLSQWKRETLERITSFKVPPSIVSRTKHGFHVYWLLSEPNDDVELFHYVQKQLVKYFDGDKNCINEARVLRLPYFMHQKDPRKKYPVTVPIFEPEIRYSQSIIKQDLPELDEEDSIFIPEREPLIELVGDKKEKLVEILIDRLENSRLRGNSISARCCMPDHADRNPSAWFDIQYLWYHCSCGASYSIFQLAEVMGWEDVSKLLGHYPLDIQGEINKLKSSFLLPSTITSTSEVEKDVQKITDDVLLEFSKRNQTINSKHVEYIFNIVCLLLTGKRDKPSLITLDMGGGKSTIIETFIKVMLRQDKNFGAILVLERIIDVKKIVSEINDELGYKALFEMYGFDKTECLMNQKNGCNYTSCAASKNKSKCSEMNSCRYWGQKIEQIDYPVLVMTSERLLSSTKGFTSKYGYFMRDDKRIERKWLMVDEKPKFIYIAEYPLKLFQSLTDNIKDRLLANGYEKESLELSNAVTTILSLYDSASKYRKIIEQTNCIFGFSEATLRKHTELFDITDKEFAILEFISCVIRNGGIIETKTVKGQSVSSIATSRYHNYRQFQDFNTYIFDGTGDMDADYIHGRYHAYDFEPLRTFEGLTLYQCANVRGTKSIMEQAGTVQSFCNDVRIIANENPSEKIFLPVFKSQRNEVESFLSDLIQDGKIKVAHYGSTKGSNKYQDCNIVILGGILHKGEGYYMAKTKAILEQKGESLESLDGLTYTSRRFIDPRIEIFKILDMLVDYSQELKRSSQRDSSKNVFGKIFMFYKDDILLQYMGIKFPGCNVVKWSPKNMLDLEIDRKGNATNMHLVKRLLKEEAGADIIWYSTLLKRSGLSKGVFSRTFNHKKIQEFISALGYAEEDDENKLDKRQRYLTRASSV